MGIQLPGDLIPGAVGVVETNAQTVTISDGSTSATATFSLDGDFDAVSAMALIADAGIAALSGSSSTTEVTDAEVDVQNATTDSVDVTVEVDTAPGTGESADVQVSLFAAEGGD